MFQGLWLSIKNKFRNTANANTDIAGAALVYADEDSFIPKESSPVGVSEHRHSDSGSK